MNLLTGLTVFPGNAVVAGAPSAHPADERSLIQQRQVKNGNLSRDITVKPPFWYKRIREPIAHYYS